MSAGFSLDTCAIIVEAHGGSQTLQNRLDRSGCIVRIELPLA